MYYVQHAVLCALPILSLNPHINTRSGYYNYLQFLNEENKAQ